MCQRCEVCMLLSRKELELGLRNSEEYICSFVLSDDCRDLEPHKTGRRGTRNKIDKCFMFDLVVLPGYMGSLSRETKAVRL